jgi:hypothetical protein
LYKRLKFNMLKFSNLKFKGILKTKENHHAELAENAEGHKQRESKIPLSYFFVIKIRKSMKKTQNLVITQRPLRPLRLYRRFKRRENFFDMKLLDWCYNLITTGSACPFMAKISPSLLSLGVIPLIELI